LRGVGLLGLGSRSGHRGFSLCRITTRRRPAWSISTSNPCMPSTSVLRRLPSPCGDKASGECRYKPSHIMVRVGHRARLRVEHPIDLSWNSQRPRLDHPPLVPIAQDIGQNLRKLLLQQAVHQLAFTKGVCQRCYDGVLMPEGPTTGSTPISRWKRKWWGRSASDPTSQDRQQPDFERVEPYGTCAIGSPAWEGTPRRT